MNGDVAGLGHPVDGQGGRRNPPLLLLGEEGKNDVAVVADKTNAREDDRSLRANPDGRRASTSAGTCKKVGEVRRRMAAAAA